MVRAALGIVYLLASATANGWSLLKLGLSTGSNRTESGGPHPEGRGGPSRPDPDSSQEREGTTNWWGVAWSRAYSYVGAEHGD